MTKTVLRKNKKGPAARRQRSAKRVNGASTRRNVTPRPPRVKIKVTAALLQEMTRRLVEEFHPEQVILFGSYAWGKPNKDSDVDLMVIVSESDETDYARMVRAFDALIGLGVPKDIFVKTRAEFERYRGVRASLQNRIAEKGKVLYDYAKKPSHAEMVHHR